MNLCSNIFTLSLARRDKNLQVGDVCNLKYENKIRSTYRICVVHELFYSEDGVVRTVKVGYRSRRQLRGVYKSAKLEGLTIAVQRLVLLVAVEEVDDLMRN